MRIERYGEGNKEEWNLFLTRSKNGHFFFNRDYMDYHSLKFTDFSLIVYDETNKVVALLPANIEHNVIHSHQGLTFGGFLIDDKMKTELMVEIFSNVKSFLQKSNVKKLVYKCIPYIYHVKPAEEDRYALFMHDAKLIRRDVSSAIYLDKDIRYSKGRKWSINKAKKEAVEVFESNNISIFWGLLEDVLDSKHNTKPVHTLNEIQILLESFPKNIKLYFARKDDQVVSGALVFENQDIAHTQYLANNDLGRELGALDCLIDYLIKDVYKK